MTEIVSFAAQPRARAGKGPARAARRAGLIPAVIYGDRQEPVLIALEDRLVRAAVNRPGFFTSLLDIELEGARHRVLPRDVQFDPVTDRPLHLDLLRVSQTTRVSVDVPVHFLNEERSPGITKGGVLNVVRHEVEVECRADSIPARIEVDLAGFDVGDSIHISHVKLPEDVRPTIQDRDFTIATIAAPSALKAEAEEAAAAAGEEAPEPEEAEEE